MSDKEPLADRSRHAERCAQFGHPPVTYNPQMDRTWCACGAETRKGEHEKDHRFCSGCGGDDAPVGNWGAPE